MVMRINSRQVTFRRPFFLSGFDAPQAAGTYTVDTEEELLETLSFPAWKRAATTMRLTHAGATEYRPINPDELNEALVLDAAPPNSSVPPFPPNSRAENARAALRAVRARRR